jgi:hypothetical protein
MGPRMKYQLYVTGLLLLGLSLIAGCGGESGPKRVSVSGTVEHAGQPLAKGSVSYLPTAGGPAATTGIVDGRYEFTSETGPVAGPQQVVVRSAAPGKGLGEEAQADPKGKFSNTEQKTWKLDADVPDEDSWENNLTLPE